MFSWQLIIQTILSQVKLEVAKLDTSIQDPFL